jgi:hypothetical protein
VGGATSGLARGEAPAEFITGEAPVSIVYPNPVQDELKMRLKYDAEIRSVSISTMNGLQVDADRNDEKTIDVSRFPPGMYILSIETTKGLIKEKFMKQ